MQHETKLPPENELKEWAWYAVCKLWNPVLPGIEALAASIGCCYLTAEIFRYPAWAGYIIPVEFGVGLFVFGLAAGYLHHRLDQLIGTERIFTTDFDPSELEDDFFQDPRDGAF